MGKKFLVIIIISIIILFSIGLIRHKLQTTIAPTTVGADSIPVRVQRVELHKIQKILEYVGNVKAQDEVLVYPKITGKIIEKLKEEGELVTKGEVIAYVDRDEVGLKFEKAPIESPIDGIIGQIFIDIGSQVTSYTAMALSTQAAVALIVRMEIMKIDLDIPEVYASRISLNQQASINFDAYPKEVFVGTISRITPVLNLLNRAFPVEIQIDNRDHRLKSGMFAKVQLVIEEHDSVPVILKEAIIGKDPDTFVYVIEDNKATLKKVVTGMRQGNLVEIMDGVREGDMVVIMGQQRLYENAPVRTEIDSNKGS